MQAEHPVVKMVNAWGAQGRPFLFLVDFELQHPRLFALEDLKQADILIQFPNYTNSSAEVIREKEIHLQKQAVARSRYQEAFEIVFNELHYGNSFLTNLTMATPVQFNASLTEIYHRAKARYKICYRDEWLCFSPETFVTIQDGYIRSCPMKGTIDAALPDAAQIILNDAKEKAEHFTIVDLIRNDLSQVAKHVEVDAFRYIDKLHTSSKDLLQVSSSIRGQLPDSWRQELGDLLWKLLPAGSVSGAPKRKTLEIIRKAEKEPRGFYTGVAFYFDGENLDSCVLIRFIEKQTSGYFYRSGGGITTQSKVDTEYQELIDKIYVPIS